MKSNFIASSFPLIAALTFGIYPFVMGVILCTKSNECENKGLAIACGVLNILGVGYFCFLTFIMGFFLKPKK